MDIDVLSNWLKGCFDMGKLLIEEPPLQVLPRLAKAIGLNEAIVLQQIHYWLQKKINFRDGRFWVYGSMTKWNDEQFPFWGLNTVKRTFNSLETSGLLVTGNYNKASFDKTKWYSIDYEKLKEVEQRLAQNDSTIDPKWVDGEAQNGSDNTLDFTKTSKEIKDIGDSNESPSPSKKVSKGNEYNEDFLKLWKLYPRPEGKSVAHKHYLKAIKDGVTNKQIQDGIVKYKKHILKNKLERQFIKQGSTFFSQRCWEDEFDVGTETKTRIVVDMDDLL